jgi:hypothetical protein
MGKIIGSAAGRNNRLWVRRAARTAVKLRVVSDTRAPETSITSGPSGTTESTSATFAFRADEKRSRFECRVDSGDWRSCSSPISYSEVPAGDHEFEVRARDRAGNVDPSPAWRTWTVAAPESIVPDTTTPDDAAPVDESQPAPVDETTPTSTATTTGDVLFSDSFTGLDGVITNHYAFWSPDDKTAFRSPDWEMESGCALRKDNTLWSGVPTANEPNRDCSNGSGSEIFRLWTKNSYGDVAVSMSLRNNGFVSGADGERSWDGVKIWLRRQGGSGSVGLYTVEVNRRQGNIMIQKKCAGSDVYNILKQDRPEGSAAKIGEWEHVGGSVRNQADGSVKLTLVRHGETVLEAVDTGVGCAPITTPGRTGFRGDYTNFNVDDFTVVPVV